MEREKDLCLLIDSSNDGKKIIDILYKHFGMSGRFVRSLKKEKCVYVDGRSVSIYSRVKDGDMIEIFFPHESCRDLPNASVALNVLYEDKWLLAVDKPAGLLVHPIKVEQIDTLSNGIAYHMKSIGEDYLVRHVNRLDRDTSGVVLIAKNGYVHDQIAIQMSKNEVEKTYIAILNGMMGSKTGTLDFPIGKPDPKNIKREVMDDGKSAKTLYEVLSESRELSLVKINLVTGRTHQIRVHMSYIGNPVLGDGLYGGDSDSIGRQALHAYSYEFKHPMTNKTMIVKSELPEDMHALVGYKNFD